MTNHEWATLNLPNYVYNLSQVRGRVRVYQFNRFGGVFSLPCVYMGVSKDTARHGGGRVTITVAKRGVPHRMQSVYRTQIHSLDEWRQRRDNND